MTLFRWVQRFTPLLIDAARPCRHAPSDRWFVDETYVNVAGRWAYLYRAVDQFGQVIDVLASAKRDLAAGRRFLTRALPHGRRPVEVPTDRAASCPRVLDEQLPAAHHVDERYTNNVVEADQGRFKARLRPMRGLKRLGSAQVVGSGRALVQNIRHGHYELGANVEQRQRLAAPRRSRWICAPEGRGPRPGRRPPRRRLVAGCPDTHLLDAAHDSRLMVLGAEVSRIPPSVAGSTASECLARATCPPASCSRSPGGSPPRGAELGGPSQRRLGAWRSVDADQYSHAGGGCVNAVHGAPSESQPRLFDLTVAIGVSEGIGHRAGRRGALVLPRGGGLLPARPAPSRPDCYGGPFSMLGRTKRPRLFGVHASIFGEANTTRTAR